MAQPTDLPHVKWAFPKNPDPSKVAVLRTTAIQVRTPPLEGPGFEENGCWTNTTSAELSNFRSGSQSVSHWAAWKAWRSEAVIAKWSSELATKPVKHAWTWHEVHCKVFTTIESEQVEPPSLSCFLGGHWDFWKGYLRRWFSLYWSMTLPPWGCATRCVLPVSRKGVRSPLLAQNTLQNCSETLIFGFTAVPSSQLDHASPLILRHAIQDRQSGETSSLRTITKKVVDVVLSIIPYKKDCSGVKTHPVVRHAAGYCGWHFFGGPKL